MNVMIARRILCCKISAKCPFFKRRPGELKKVGEPLTESPNLGLRKPILSITQVCDIASKLIQIIYTAGLITLLLIRLLHC
jgi:hypothetical protein